MADRADEKRHAELHGYRFPPEITSHAVWLCTVSKCGAPDGDAFRWQQLTGQPLTSTTVNVTVPVG